MQPIYVAYSTACLLAVLGITVAVTLSVAKTVSWGRPTLVFAVGGLAIPCVLLCLALYYFFELYRTNSISSSLVYAALSAMLIKAAMLATPFSLAASFSVIKLVDRKSKRGS